MGYLMVHYFDSLQKNDVIARPTGWMDLFLDPSVRKKHGLTLQAKSSSSSSTKKSLVQSHPWFDLSSSDHYSLANTESEFKAQMKAGLLLPVLILPNIELGLAIGSQHNWSSEIYLDDL